MTFKKIARWALLSGFMIVGNAFGVKLDSIPSKEIPVKTLTSSGGLNVLSSELHTTPLVSLYIGAKNIPTDSIFYPDRFLIVLLQNLLQDKADKKREIERARHSMKENTPLPFRIDYRSILDEVKKWQDSEDSAYLNYGNLSMDKYYNLSVDMKEAEERRILQWLHTHMLHFRDRK